MYAREPGIVAKINALAETMNLVLAAVRRIEACLKPLATSADDAAAMPGAGTLMTYEDVTRELGICRETIWRKVSAGKMPKPIKLGYRTVRFRRADIDEWVAGGCKSLRSKPIGRR